MCILVIDTFRNWIKYKLHAMYLGLLTGVDKGDSPPPNGRAKKDFFVTIEGLSSFT